MLADVSITTMISGCSISREVYTRPGTSPTRCGNRRLGRA